MSRFPVEFLTVYRDEEYIRTHTKGMISDEARRFALAYYGWDDDSSGSIIQKDSPAETVFLQLNPDEELPFQ